jgi:hypothetical protein
MGFNEVTKPIYTRKVTMSLSLKRFGIIAIAMMTLSACGSGSGSATPEGPAPTPTPPIVPEARHSVSLNAPDSVEQNTVFTMTATPAESEGTVSYQWSLNDGVISEDPSHHTMLPALGDYTLSVIATDEAGNNDTQSKVITVVAQASLNPEFSFTINVSDKSGAALEAVPVTINGTTVNTDQYGLAQFDDISQTSLMLVSASKAGYLTQTYQYSFDTKQESAVASLTLQNINLESHTVDSTEAVDITETELHTKLILPANSFVDAEGNAVTGDVKITITPIDIRAVDSAFLGGGQALTETGEAVALISTGMADYQFTQNGSAVSLAEGASATIEMDLAVTTGDDGRVFAVGDTIEMWWFDTVTGFWVEDGVGTVELSATSETGLKLVAIVNHFTTWNWDYYKQDDRSSITFKCLKNNAALAADESCRITASSTSINRQMVAGSDGVTAVNTPPSVTYSVTANATADGSLWSGSASITTVPGDNTVTVNMATVTTQTGYVQCRIINNSVTSIVPCSNIITAGSIDPQDIDTADSNNYRASFIYIKGDSLDISATTGSGLNQSTSINTSSINGTLDIEIVFDIKLGSLQCSATLSGTDKQYFPCDAVVADVNEDFSFRILADDFTGDPLKARFTYSKDAQGLSIEVSSIFDGDSEPTVVDIDLTTTAAIAYVTYEANPENLFTFECVDSLGNDVDCDITWYSPSESIIFSGNINELSDPSILPTWMNGKVFTESSGFGEASEYDQGLYSEDPDIDTVNKVITFTLEEVPY